MFPTFFLAGPLDNLNKTLTFFPLMGGVRYFCPLFRGFLLEEFVLILSGLLTIVRYLEVSAIRDVH